MSRCPAVGALLVHGVEVAALRCRLGAEHVLPSIVDGERREATPHECVLTWADEHVLQGRDWPEAFDTGEVFDTEVPITHAAAWDEAAQTWPAIRDRLDNGEG